MGIFLYRVAITEDLEITVDQLPETALRYILSHPAISTVIPGMRSIKNVISNCQTGDGKGLPEEMVQKIKSHRWVRNFYQA